MKPLQAVLSDLEESIKHTVMGHKDSTSGKWANLLQRLESTTTLSVYCDCSVIAGRFHLGVCIAGILECRLYGTTVTTKFPQHNVLGEIHAIEFAIHCVEDFMMSPQSYAVKSVAVFSDVEHIQRLLNCKTQRIHQPVSWAVPNLNLSINRFSETYPAIRLRINYLGNEAQRSNSYYNAAHKVARTVARFNTRTKW